MSQLIHSMPYGTSEPQDFQLLNDDLAFDATGYTVSIEWRSPAPSNPPSVAWLDQTTSKVRVTGTGTMAIGRYPFRFKLVDGSSRVGYASNAAGANLWQVVAV